MKGESNVSVSFTDNYGETESCKVRQAGMNTPAIYAIVHIQTWRLYIGSTVHLWDRWARHRQDLRQGKHHSIALQRAWNKHGGAAFGMIVLEAIENVRNWPEAHKRVSRQDARRQTGLSTTKRGLGGYW